MMERTSDLVVDSVTGVEVALPVAGPGARSFAFVIDWTLRCILSVAWYVVAALIHNRAWSLMAPLDPDAMWFVAVIAPAGTLFFLYHPVLEMVTRGLTPGKRMAGLQIISRNGGAPSVGAILTRNVFRVVDSFPVAYAVGLATSMLTRDHVRIGDLAAGTLLVYAHAWSAPVPGRPQSPLDADTAEIATELLQRWPNLEPQSRRRLAMSVLQSVQHVSSPDSVADDELLRNELARLVAIDA